MSSVVIVQSNYIPWKGYFDLIASASDFVFYDEVQYTKNDWRNRNKIKMAGGAKWLTIPVDNKGKFGQKIAQTRVANTTWARSHWLSISQSYAKSPYFASYRDLFFDLYQQAEKLEYLSEINCLFIGAICQLLSIDTRIHQARDFAYGEGKTERLVQICRLLEAQKYISGPAAKSYLDQTLFAKADIAVEWFNYGPYPQYDQLYPPFEAAVSILDLIFMTGPDAPKYALSKPVS